MLFGNIMPRSVTHALLSILLILYAQPTTCGTSPVESQTDSQDGGHLQSPMLSYAVSPTRLDSNEAHRLVSEQSVHTPQRTVKRFSKFVRVGRGNPGAFVRIGKGNDMNDASDGLFTDFQETEPEIISYPDKRPMHRFIRIGRGMESYDFDKNMLDEENDDDDTNSYDRYRKSPSSFVRIGKAPNKFVRIGKSPSSFVRIGKSPSSFVRIGKSPSSFVRIGKSPSSFVRIGKSPSSFVRIGKSPSSFVRIGKDMSDEATIFNDKRPSSFVRIGRSAPKFVEPQNTIGDDIKRPSSFVRIGKSSSVLDSPAKRPSSFVRIGKSVDTAATEDINQLKRAFVRIGKSTSSNQETPLIENVKKPSSFLRIGKSDNTDVLNKRAGNFVRIGRLAKLHAADNKRAFVRIGKSASKTTSSGKSQLSELDAKPSSEESLSNEHPKGDAGPISVSSRGSAFVRIGKIPSSAFVRIGKNSNVMVEGEPARVYSFNRGSRGAQSSFVRIG